MPQELSKLIEELSEIERQALSLIEEKSQAFEELKKKTTLNADSLRRALAWLQEKGLAEIAEEKTSLLELSLQGITAADKGLAEKQFLQTLKKLGGSAPMQELQQKTGLGNEFNKALGIARQQAFISLKKTGKGMLIELTGREKEFLGKESEAEKLIKKLAGKKIALNELSEKENKALEELKLRHLIVTKEIVARQVRLSAKGLQAKSLLGEAKGEITVLTKSLIESGAWKDKKMRKFNLTMPVPELFMGKKQPYIQFLEEVRARLVRLGFQELYSPAIVSEFYNFDVLFQPQNHPARTWTETYKLKKPEAGRLPEKRKVAAVKAAHEYGGISASRGWQYSWSEIIASKLMPAAHTTAYTGMALVKGIKIPGKYFALGRVYRPDVLDARHLLEFNQLDGIVADKELNFRHLLGILKEFAIEIAGAEKVRFYPDYYPFTEPSVQLSAKHPEMGWIEFAGAGIFRPEMTENLGVKEPVLAWGMGVDRLAMFKLGIKDIRQLFSDDLTWLRKAKILGVES